MKKNPYHPDWPVWRLVWHWIIGHELTNWDRFMYPSPVCRDCEMDKLLAERRKEKL